MKNATARERRTTPATAPTVVFVAESGKVAQSNESGLQCVCSRDMDCDFLPTILHGILILYFVFLFGYFCGRNTASRRRGSRIPGHLAARTYGRDPSRSAVAIPDVLHAQRKNRPPEKENFPTFWGGKKTGAEKLLGCHQIDQGKRQSLRIHLKSPRLRRQIHHEVTGIAVAVRVDPDGAVDPVQLAVPHAPRHHQPIPRVFPQTQCFIECIRPEYYPVVQLQDRRWDLSKKKETKNIKGWRDLFFSWHYSPGK